MEDKRLKVKRLLSTTKLTQVWLIERMRSYGVITDASELSAALSGTRRGPKINRVLDTAIYVLEDYETRMAL